MSDNLLDKYKVELVYSIEEDSKGKYLEHRLKVGNNNQDLLKRLYYLKLNAVYVNNMPSDELLHFSSLIDSEINRRFGTGEFGVIRDS